MAIIKLPQFQPELMLLDDNGDTDNDVVMMTDDEVGEVRREMGRVIFDL